MKIISTVLTLLGALGLFLYGMRVMSEALQKITGKGLRKSLSAITKNKWKGILSGTFITGLIQSSTAVTIMIVSFVNAGLLSLYESVSLIVGANIGTTVTLWLIVLFGFHFSINIWALPLVGISLFLFFSGKNKIQYWGQFIIGFALIFIGIDFITKILPDIQESSVFSQYVSNLTGEGMRSVFIFLGIGLFFTALMQSSSLAVTLTLIMCYKGWIDFEGAAAMILGENIGTTVTANLAAVITNKTAKRAALFHTLFNVLGMVWALPLFKIMLNLIIHCVGFFTNASPVYDIRSIPISLAIFHTAFNIINAAILVWFFPFLIKITGTIVRVGKEGKENYRLKHLYRGLMPVSEISILQAKNEIIKFGRHADGMYNLLQKLFHEINQSEFNRLFDEIKKDEQQSDQMEKEITSYLSRLSDRELSEESTCNSHIMFKLADELESVCDSIYNIARAIRRKKKEKIWFTQDIRDNLNQMFVLLQKAFHIMNSNLETDFIEADISKALSIEKEINKYRKNLLQTNLKTDDTRDYKYQAGILYNDIFNRYERLGDYVYNISKIIGEFNGLKEKGE